MVVDDAQHMPRLSVHEAVLANTEGATPFRGVEDESGARLAKISDLSVDGWHEHHDVVVALLPSSNVNGVGTMLLQRLVADDDGVVAYVVSRRLHDTPSRRHHNQIELVGLLSPRQNHAGDMIAEDGGGGQVALSTAREEVDGVGGGGVVLGLEHHVVPALGRKANSPLAVAVLLRESHVRAVGITNDKGSIGDGATVHSADCRNREKCLASGRLADGHARG
mmetsp:Transcript_29993/g.70576  ORF Transcript_29993/g.70576 Transcript_29993/m.70576 type:complete len:222 (+) Transcript_29993:88-753(+)